MLRRPYQFGLLRGECNVAPHVLIRLISENLHSNVTAVILEAAPQPAVNKAEHWGYGMLRVRVRSYEIIDVRIVAFVCERCAPRWY
jgi:hypothetical protein